jgi:hypothetical protein
MMSHRKYSEALYAASMRADVAIAVGEFDVARFWFAKGESVTRGVSAQLLNPHAGARGTAGVLAMLLGHYDEAAAHFLEAQRYYSIMAAARLHAVVLGHLLRNEQLRSQANLDGHVTQLRDLYGRGKSLGGQDTIVEALWCALTLDGDSKSASLLLSEYLSMHRREQSLPEWSLRNAAAADDAWHAYYSRARAPRS